MPSRSLGCWRCEGGGHGDAPIPPAQCCSHPRTHTRTSSMMRLSSSTCSPQMQSWPLPYASGQLGDSTTPAASVSSPLHTAAGARRAWHRCGGTHHSTHQNPPPSLQHPLQPPQLEHPPSPLAPAHVPATAQWLQVSSWPIPVSSTHSNPQLQHPLQHPSSSTRHPHWLRLPPCPLAPAPTEPSAPAPPTSHLRCPPRHAGSVSFHCGSLGSTHSMMVEPCSSV